MPAPKGTAPVHNGMQTVIFTCAHGDTHRVHGHTAHAPHRHEVGRVRRLMARGCPVKRPKPGVVYRAKKGSKKGALPIPPCGAKVTESVVNHPTPVGG